MSIAAGSLAGTNILKSAIEDRLARELEFQIPQVDPLFAKMLNAASNGSSGRVRKEDLRNDYRIVMPYKERQARGVVQFDPAGASLYGGTNAPIGRFGRSIEDSAFFPDPRLDTGDRYAAFGVPMRAQTFTIRYSFFEDMVDNLDAFEGSIRGNELIGLAQNIMRIQYHSLWADQNDYFAYGTYDAADTANSIEAASSTSQSDIGGVARDRLIVVLRERTEMRLVPGMMVDLVRTGEGTTSSGDEDDTINVDGNGARVPGYISRISPLSGEVEIEFWTFDSSGDRVPAGIGTGGSDLFDPLPTGGVIAIVPSNNRSSPTSGTRYGIHGVHAYLKSSGNLLGDDAISGQTLNVTSVPACESLIKAIDGPLSEDVLIRHVETICGRLEHLRNRTVDMVVTTPGVLIAYNQTRIPGVQYVRGLTDSAVPTLEGQGFDHTKTVFHTGTKTLPIEVSRSISAGLLYGLPTGMQNWKIFTPPTGSVTGFKQLPAPNLASIPVTTVGQYVGYPSERVPILRSGGDYTQITDQYQIPGMIHYNICPEEPGGCLLLTGLTEDYVTL